MCIPTRKLPSGWVSPKRKIVSAEQVDTSWQTMTRKDRKDFVLTLECGHKVKRSTYDSKPMAENACCPECGYGIGLLQRIHTLEEGESVQIKNVNVFKRDGLWWVQAGGGTQFSKTAWAAERKARKLVE